MSSSSSSTADSIEIDIRSRGGVTVVALTGDLDTSTSRAVRTDVLPRVEPDGKMIMDLSAVSYMSSAGLRFLLSLYRHTANHNGNLALVGVSPEIRDTMEVTGFLDFFVVCPSMQDAMSAVGAAL